MREPVLVIGTGSNSPGTSNSVEQDAITARGFPLPTNVKGESRATIAEQTHLDFSPSVSSSDERDDVASTSSINQFSFSQGSTINDDMTKEETAAELDRDDFFVPAINFIDTVNNWIFNEDDDVLSSSGSSSRKSSIEDKSDGSSFASSRDQSLERTSQTSTRFTDSWSRSSSLHSRDDDGDEVTNRLRSRTDSECFAESESANNEISETIRLMEIDLAEFDRQFVFATQLVDNVSTWIVGNQDDSESLDTELHSVPSSTNTDDSILSSTSNEASTSVQTPPNQTSHAVMGRTRFKSLRHESSMSDHSDHDLDGKIMDLVDSVLQEPKRCGSATFGESLSSIKTPSVIRCNSQVDIVDPTTSISTSQMYGNGADIVEQVFNLETTNSQPENTWKIEVENVDSKFVENGSNLTKDGAQDESRDATSTQEIHMTLPGKVDFGIGGNPLSTNGARSPLRNEKKGKVITQNASNTGVNITVVDMTRSFAPGFEDKIVGKESKLHDTIGEADQSGNLKSQQWPAHDSLSVSHAVSSDDSIGINQTRAIRTRKKCFRIGRQMKQWFVGLTSRRSKHSKIDQSANKNTRELRGGEATMEPQIIIMSMHQNETSKSVVEPTCHLPSPLHKCTTSETVDREHIEDADDDVDRKGENDDPSGPSSRVHEHKGSLKKRSLNKIVRHRFHWTLDLMTRTAQGKNRKGEENTIQKSWCLKRVPMNRDLHIACPQINEAPEGSHIQGHTDNEIEVSWSSL